MVKTITVVGLCLEHHRIAVSAGNRRYARMSLDLHRAALHKGLLGFRRHGIGVFLKHRAHGAFHVLGIELEIAGVGTQKQVRLGVVPALKGKLFARLGRELNAQRGRLALHAVALTVHHIFARHGRGRLNDNVHLAGTRKLRLDHAVGNGLKGIRTLARNQRRRSIRATIAQIPTVKDIALGWGGLRGHALTLGDLENHAGSLAALQRNGAALERVSLGTHSMRIPAVHYSLDPSIPVNAVFANFLLVGNRDALRIGFAPLYKPVRFLWIVGAHLGPHRKRENVAILRANLAVHDRYAIAQNLGAVEGIGIHQDGLIRLAEARNQMAVDLGLEDIRALGRNLDAVLKPSHKGIVRTLTRGDHSLIATGDALLYGACGAARREIGLNAIGFGNCRDLDFFLENSRHLYDLGRRFRNGHRLEGRCRDLDAVLFPAYEAIAGIGDSLQRGNRSLIVDTAASDDAAHLGLCGGNNLDRMVAMRLRLLVVIDDVLDLLEHLGAHGGNILNVIGHTDLDHRVGRDGVDNLAQAVHGGEDRRSRDRGDKRGLKRRE